MIAIHFNARSTETLTISHFISKKIRYSQLFAYNMGMTGFDQYIDAQLLRGRAYFTSEEALAELRVSPLALKAAIGRMTKKQRVANLRHGFYLILRPEDRAAGAPDPARWIDPLMKYQGIDYRVSLLRAAAFHGSSHQAAMTFQVIVPKQLHDLEIGRHRLQFVYQAPAAFAQVNQSEWLGNMKSEAGFAKVAGIELTLLDCARYFHKSAGINGLAQIVKDLGAQADASKLASAAVVYENASVRRLGYLLDQAGCEPQARALEPFVKEAKTSLLLDPSVKPLIASLAEEAPRVAKWKLVINEPVEVDF
jgi:predicted transcriptional regulator of viral defense system